LKEIPVSKRNLIIAVILAVVIAVDILVIENWPLRAEQGSAASTDKDNLVSAAAVNAIEKVFQVIYQEGKEDWLERIGELSAPAGCELFSVGADRLWDRYIKAKSVVTAAAQALKKWPSMRANRFGKWPSLSLPPCLAATKPRTPPM
jgi:hypothetical protein